MPAHSETALTAFQSVKEATLPLDPRWLQTAQLDHRTALSTKWIKHLQQLAEHEAVTTPAFLIDPLCSVADPLSAFSRQPPCATCKILGTAVTHTTITE